MHALRLGGYQAETSILTRALRRLAASLADVAGAGWKVEVVPDVTKRDQRAADLFAMVESGGMEMCYFASSYLVGRVPALGRFDAPFAALDRASLWADLDGAAGKALTGELEEATGYKLLGYWDNGLRHISNRLRPIRHPRDCGGMRIRTLDNANYQRLLAAVGFTPLVIDVKDLVRAVETGEVDAQENPLTNTVNFGLHRTHKHLSLTGHFHGVALLLANRAWFEGLDSATQAALASACSEVTAVQRQWAIDEDSLCLDRLRQDGVAIVPEEEIDFAAFRAAAGGAT